MARALVTGITGQTGSYLAELLVARGWQVHGLVRAGDELPESLVGAGDSSVVEHIGDLVDAPRLGEIMRDVAPDAVFHLGGLTSVAESWKRPVDFALTTAMPTATLLAASEALQKDRAEPVAFVHASSAEIFGEPETSPQTESTPIAPVSPYGAAKAYGHMLVQTYRRSGLSASNCILYNHESPRRPPTFVTRKITRGVARIARGLESTIVLGNLDARRDWGWAPDYAEAILRASTVADDLVIATGVKHSVRDFVTAAFRAVGIDDGLALVEQDKRFMRPSDAPELLGDARRANDVLGWSPSVTFDELVRRMVEADLAVIDRETAES